MVSWFTRRARLTAAGVLLALWGLGVTGTAKADFVSPITFMNADPNASMALTIGYDPGGNPTAHPINGALVGQYLMHDANGTQFNAFCVDLGHSMPGTPYAVTTASTSTVFGTPLGNELAFLANTYLSAPGPNGGLAAQAYLATKGYTATTQQAEAAVQLAVWTLEYGNKFSYTQNNGGPNSGEISAFTTQASGDHTSVASVLQSSPSSDPSLPQGQSVMVSGPPSPAPGVPEPSSIVLLGMGLFGFGAYRLRKRPVVV